MKDPADLSNMRDVATPPDVSWWPPAIGWWVLAVVLLVTTALSAFWALREWKKGAYRRQALRDLRKAKSTVAAADLLKRTALAAYPRVDVAGMTGSAWCDWLRTSGHLEASESVCHALTTTIYRDDSQEIAPELRQFAMKWITQHQTAATDETDVS